MSLYETFDSVGHITKRTKHKQNHMIPMTTFKGGM